jgi:signal transduction histidine kinase
MPRQSETALARSRAIAAGISEQNSAEQTLRDLSNRLLRSQDEERRRIARELHDGTAQNLTAVVLNLQRLLARGGRLDGQARDLIDESIELVTQSLAEVRTLSYWLHPPFLDETGLPSALRWYADGFTRRSSIKIDLELSPDIGRLGSEAEMALFRVVQESLGNVRRHSGADAARIRLIRTAKKAVLTISDNGQGLPADAVLRRNGDIPCLGVGIAGMKARLKQLGGRLDVDSSRRGTTVRATIPHPVA